jgi:hypothetical protein
MTGIWQIRRSHGILGGVLLTLLGIWGGLIPFVGPYFHYAYTPDKAWTYNTGRLWLEILPGAAALLGGIVLVITRSRHTALFGAFLGIASGAWFAVGNTLAPLWTVAAPAGVPASITTLMRAMEEIGFFTGLGVVMVLVAAVEAGRVPAVPGVTPMMPAAHAKRGRPVRTVPADSADTEAITRPQGVMPRRDPTS